MDGDYKISSQEELELKRLETNLKHELRPFQAFLDDPNVSEITINNSNQELLTWESGIWRAHVVNPIDLNQLGSIVANYMDSEFSSQSPYLSGQLPDGSRIEMTMPPACPSNVIQLNIRKHSAKHFKLEEFEAMGYFENTVHAINVSLGKETRDSLRKYLNADQLKLLEFAEKSQWMDFLKFTQEFDGLNGVISGSTGSGKTSFLQALVDIIHPTQRILTVEDSDEIKTTYQMNNQELFFKRSLNKAEQERGATPTNSLMSTLRKTADRTILGELRGAEALNYIEDVCSVGSDGTLTSIHANDSRAVFSRIASLMKRDEAAKTISFSELYEKIYPVINFVVHLKFKKRENKRSCTEIYYDPIYALYREGIK